MTSLSARPLPPLTDLPPPPRLPEEETNLVPPGEIIAESRRAITRRLLRRSWAPGLVLLGLWYLLLGLYVLGSSPAFWLFSLLASLSDPVFLRSAMIDLGFTGTGLWLAALLVPLVATLLSLALLPLATSAIAGLQPRRFLTERAFQQEVSTRLAAVLMVPPVLVTLLLPVTVVLGAPQPWSGLGAGGLSMWSLGIGALLLGGSLVRRTLPAPALLDITPVAELETSAQLERDLERRHRYARQVRAQDRRHLPPSPGTEAATAAITPRGALTALAHVGRRSLTWVVPSAAGLGWIIFGITDIAAVIAGLSTANLAGVSGSALRGPQLVVLAPVLALVALGVALAPALAVHVADGHSGRITDQRTVASWAQRARTNPWEARAVGLSAWCSAAAGLAGVLVLMVLYPLLGISTPMTWTWLVLGALVLVPLLGAATHRALRDGLRDVLYGPAGDYMRREASYALVAPDIGTRAERGRDPAVRAALRRRLAEEGGDPALAILDIDQAGERLWVDDEEPGARDTAVREADLAQGILPDFGAEGSPATGGGRSAGGVGHEIPEQLGGPREA
ncbi:hypothetical protein [Brachybacterium sp. YJGR34]|uniref:hypothetical protein n=1 Tax=Brachybacterium sp. YJGR34 TaxID=2059911 RepID=UPI000E0AD338|nr:hypothetical protein [Brachybacterium sp. YJGR34]